MANIRKGDTVQVIAGKDKGTTGTVISVDRVRARVLVEGVNRVKANSDLGVMLITHYTRILRYIKPDYVHVFANGKIVEEGGPELADKLAEKGYAEYITA